MTPSSRSVAKATFKNLITWILISALCVSSALGDNANKILEELNAASEGYGILSNMPTLIDLASNSTRPPGSYQYKSADSPFRRFITLKDNFVDYTFKITKENQSCSAFFMTDELSKLTFEISGLNLLRCDEEYLYVNDGATIESTICGGKASLTSRGSRFLLLQFGRQTNTATVFNITVKAVPDVDEEIEITDKSSRPEQSFSDSQICATCGYHVGSSIRSRVMGGYTARVTEYPWIVQIYIRREGYNIKPELSQCGATILTQKYLLTAAHCVRPPTSEFPWIFIDVVAGSDHGFEAQMLDNQSQKNEVDYVVYHSLYKRVSQDDRNCDIAVLRLVQQLQFNERVAPVCLANHMELIGSDVTVVGYGDMGEGMHARQLQAVKLNIRPIKECEVFFNQGLGVKKHSFHPEQICLYSPSNDACHGDSGGPALIKLANKFFQIGIVSFGAGCCDKERNARYGVYTRVSSFIQWIKPAIEGATC